MNTLSLVLNGKTDAYIRSLPTDSRDLISIVHLPAAKSTKAQRPSLARSAYTEYPAEVRSQRFSFSRSFSFSETMPSLTSTIVSSAPSSPTSSRPGSRRSSSRGSPGWYSKEGELTLEDFAKKLQTRSKKFEVYMGKCAQNVVMALFAPTPLVVLFLLNPISLILWTILGIWWFFGSG
ncbi:hypothetical protein CKM354_000463800 [Cercospora kikuchii]|uniref:Uncharacterized protein n=1 Tax=Cercospora kikuchii TaxID=84275 RepID=A0A9P3CG83_9PEZI|nr:uncharacterized protein CKM354_000463800 [Cercospora kikuchii]GIZ41331.1 hypothetical protein CKM354_000463800 [Cercospora kikuchii]